MIIFTSSSAVFPRAVINVGGFPEVSSVQQDVMKRYRHVFRLTHQYVLFHLWTAFHPPGGVRSIDLQRFSLVTTGCYSST